MLHFYPKVLTMRLVFMTSVLCVLCYQLCLTNASNGNKCKLKKCLLSLNRNGIFFFFFRNDQNFLLIEIKMTFLVIKNFNLISMIFKVQVNSFPSFCGKSIQSVDFYYFVQEQFSCWQIFTGFRWWL